MLNCNETVAFDKDAQYVGRICRYQDPNQALLDKIPQYYEDYQKNYFIQQRPEISRTEKGRSRDRP